MRQETPTRPSTIADLVRANMRGQMIHLPSIVCASCGCVHALTAAPWSEPVGTTAVIEQRATAFGWRFIKPRGWMCPACAPRLLNDSADQHPGGR